MKRLIKKLLRESISPKSVNSDQLALDSVVDGRRPIAWTRIPRGQTLDDVKRLGIEAMPVYPSMEHPVAKKKISSLSRNGWGRAAKDVVSQEIIVYDPAYKRQAEAARRELIRRGGYWTLDTPESDIYMARLMHYDDKDIAAYIKRNYPEFDVESAMRKPNPLED